VQLYISFVQDFIHVQVHASNLLKAKMVKSSQVPAGKEILVGGKHFYTLTEDNVTLALKNLHKLSKA